MHRYIREGLLLALLGGALIAPAGTPAKTQAAILAASDCSATGHVITGATLNRDPNWVESGLQAVASAGLGDVWAVGSASVSDFTPQAATAGISRLSGLRYDPPRPQEPPLRTSALIEHWSGTTWQAVPNPAAGSPQAGDSALYGLAVINPRNIWAVGEVFNARANTVGPLVERWNGTAWAIMSPPASAAGTILRLVAANGPDDVWVVGETPAHWDGHTWQETPVPVPPGSRPIWVALQALGTGDAWIAASLYDVNSGALTGMEVAHWDRRTWTVQTGTDLPRLTSLRAVTVLGLQDVWAAGSVDAPPGPVPTVAPGLPTPGPGTPGATGPLGGPGPLLLHWDGNVWTRVPAPGGYALDTLFFRSPNDGWAAGLDQRVDGQHFGLLHWDGTRWTPVAVAGSDDRVPYPDHLSGFVAEVPDDLWAVGSGHDSGPDRRIHLSAIHIFRDCAVPTVPAADPQNPAVSYFPTTGHTLRGVFRDYWTAHGGLAQFGYPLTDEFAEKSATDGRTYTVQYFERNRYELHPENGGTSYVVLLGLLGRDAATTASRNAPEAFAPLKQMPPGVRFFAATGHSLAPDFRAYWEAHGGLPVYGYPISEPFHETSSTDGKDYLVQYFERNRLELHPELPADYRVSLGLLGVDLLRTRGWLP